MEQLKKTIELLYTGRSRRAAYFRYTLISFDLFTIIFFIITTPLASTTKLLGADFVIGALILADFLARLWIAPIKLRMLLQLYTIAHVLLSYLSCLRRSSPRISPSFECSGLCACCILIMC